MGSGCLGCLQVRWLSAGSLLTRLSSTHACTPAALQKLPDWSSVRPRTSSRWGGSSSSDGGATPGGDVPASGWAGTPPATAPAPAARQQQQAQRPATTSRLARASTAQSHSAWDEEGVATYTLQRSGSRGSSTAQRTRAGHAAAAPPPARQRRAQTDWQEAPLPPASAKQQKGQPSARTTPFALRPNSGESRRPGWDGGGGARPAARQRPPRGTPLYDASSLLRGSGGGGGAGAPLPFSFDSLHPPGMEERPHAGLGSRGGSSLRGSLDGTAPVQAPGHGRPTRAAAGSAAAAAAAAARGQRTASLAAEAAAVAAAAAEGLDAGSEGPLGDLLSQVDRMLLQVERAIS